MIWFAGAVPTPKPPRVIPPYPGKCPACGAMAYVGAVPSDVKCSAWDCVHSERKS